MVAETHGTCQVCFRDQKLPADVLSLHGYKVDWGQFVGICFGARYPPFEVSCQRTQQYIDQIVLPEIERQEAKLARLRARPEFVLLHVTHWRGEYSGVPKPEPTKILRDAPRIPRRWEGNQMFDPIPSYDELLNSDIFKTERMISMIQRDLVDLRQKIANWQPGIVQAVTEKVPCQHEEKVYTPRPYDEAYETKIASYTPGRLRSPMYFDMHCADCKTRLGGVRELVEA